MDKRTLILLVLACTVLFGFLYIHTSYSLEARAKAIVQICKDSVYPPSCYDTEIPKLMDRGLSMEDAFTVVNFVTKLTKDSPQTYFFCHVVAHYLAGKEAAKDPSKWTEVAGRCPVGSCSNGCLHGAAQERFRDEVLSEEEIEKFIPDLAKVCVPQDGRVFTPLELTSCHHSLGHLATYITGANVPRTLAICDEIAEIEGKDYTRTCYEGAFMQIFQPLEPEDFALVKDVAPKTADAARAFCRSYTGSQLSACNTESWPLSHASLNNPEGLCATPPRWL